MTIGVGDRRGERSETRRSLSPVPSCRLQAAQRLLLVLLQVAQRLLEAHGLVVSMSRKGNCWDNAVVESFFATLKVELGDRFPSRTLAHDALFEYIEIFYNRARMHGSLGFISPAEAEVRFENEAAA